jgi:hypothetical protein
MPGTVADDDLLACTQPEHASDVMQVVGREAGVHHVVDEHLRRCRGADRYRGEFG